MTDHSYDALTRKRLRVLSWSFRFWILVALISALTWGWALLQDPQFLPIKTVKITASFQRVDKKTLEDAVTPFVPAGLLSINIKGIQRQLQQLPWIEQATIQRKWPNQLAIKVIEQKPIAVWNSTALLNASGGVFSPPQTTFPTGLPLFTGPAGQQQVVLEEYQQFSAQLSPLHLAIVQLSLDQRRSWQMMLNNGMVVVLGKESPFLRFNRFVAIYPKLFVDSSKTAVHIDMRYADGLAVQWQNKPTINVSNPSPAILTAAVKH